MSYRLITKATITVKPVTGDPIVGDIAIRAYPAPKSPAKGQLTIDGSTTDFRRTGGRGRGLVNHQYLYAMVGKESGFWEITEAMGSAITAGATITVESKATKAELETIQAAVDKHGADAVVAAANAEQAPETSKKAMRRSPKAVAA